MALLDWSMSMIGYPAHRRCGVPVVGLSHMSVHAALRFAEAHGLFTGWVVSSGPAPHLEGLRPEVPTWVALAEFFVERRVAYTEGMISGALTFVHAVPADGQPPEDRSIEAWAESLRKPWVQVIDNEVAYWGGVDDVLVDALLCWHLCERPIDKPWTQTSLEPEGAAVLRRQLFATGLTRNLSLCRNGWRTAVDLWSGVHHRCMLDHGVHPPLSSIQQGWRAQLRGDVWSVQELDGNCPLDDERGRVTPPVQR